MCTFLSEVVLEVQNEFAFAINRLPNCLQMMRRQRTEVSVELRKAGFNFEDTYF